LLSRLGGEAKLIGALDEKRERAYIVSESSEVSKVG
jgi:hypothetical protein